MKVRQREPSGTQVLHQASAGEGRDLSGWIGQSRGAFALE